MALSKIAEGLEIVDEQQDRGVAAIDDTDATLADRLARYDDELPCDPDAAATVVQTHTAGTSVGDSARAVGIEPITAAKTLHLLGIDGVNPLGPNAREIVRDWLVGGLSRSTARTLTGASDREFALAAFVESHEPIEGAIEAVEGAFAAGECATVQRDLLADTMTDAGDLR